MPDYETAVVFALVNYRDIEERSKLRLESGNVTFVFLVCFFLNGNLFTFRLFRNVLYLLDFCSCEEILFFLEVSPAIFLRTNF